MMLVHAVAGYRRWAGSVLAGVLLASVPSGDAMAEEWHFVLRDGRKVPLVKSDAELGIVFRSYGEVETGRQRLEAAGYGLVEDIEDAPNARVKILRVASTGDVVTDDMLADEAVEDVQPVYRFAGVNSPVIATGRMVVKLRSGLSANQRDSLWEKYGIGEVEVFKGLHDVYVVRPHSSNVDEVLLAEQLADDEQTLWANPDFRCAAQPAQVTASDQYFELQWHLHNTGQTGGVDDADIDAPEAWLVADGKDVLYGMFDDSCDVDHEDLRGNYIGIGQDVALPFFDPGYDDPRPKLWWDAHGTAVMGLAVAAGNSLGVRGVAYRAQFTASRGLLDFVSLSDIASAYTFALEQGVNVHINSWGFPGLPNPPVIVEAIETAFKEGRDLDGEGGDDPLGMVILFASHNYNAEIGPQTDLAALPQVIAVGASTDEDIRASYSNYGAELNFLAPGAGNVNLGITTTDTEDGVDNIAQGYNVGGNAVDPFFGYYYGPDIDPAGSYTGQFGGTSSACPIAAGVAGLILSVNPKLTATEVRIIMEHSCDQISPEDAQYDSITGRSFKYGYGRINAEKAVMAAKDTLTNGGVTWPDIATDVQVDGTTLRWRPGVGTDEFLVLESTRDFGFTPQNDACYDSSQLGCGAAALASVPGAANVLFVGCDENCDLDTEQSVEFARPSIGSKLFAIYARSSSGRYSFGISTEAAAIPPPAVTITALPLAGRSPLMVNFNGNALSELGIDKSRTEWDFDIDDDSIIDATSTSRSWIYIVPAGEVRTFTARLTVYDVMGNAGSAEVQIRVIGEDVDEGAAVIHTGEIRVLVGVPGTAGSDVSQGISPFGVELRIESDTPVNVQSVVWDLGDGSRSTGLVAPHVYINESDMPLVLPVTATVTTATAGGATITTTATRLITVLPGTEEPYLGEPELPGTRPLGEGGAATPCGAIGMVPLLFGIGSLILLRRRPL